MFAPSRCGKSFLKLSKKGVLLKGLLRRMKKQDLRALTPMFTSNVNPYGIFTVDFEKVSFLEAA